jgi:hypothetical protein
MWKGCQDERGHQRDIDSSYDMSDCHHRFHNYSYWKCFTMKEMTQKTRNVRDHKNRDKREEAEERQEDRSRLTSAQQVTQLNQRLGKDKGAKKERKRLTA